MKKILFVSVVLLSTLLSSCSMSNIAMREPNHRIEFVKGDFEFSEQVEAQATSVKILMIDWARLFNNKTGETSLTGASGQSNANSGALILNGVTPLDILDETAIANVTAIIPVLGNQLKNLAASNALYNLMKENPGYDVVIYPQYETKKFFIPIFYSKTTVKVKARLGKIK